MEEAVRLARSQPDRAWVMAGPPELELEIGQSGSYVDLASFVSRFEHRAHKASSCEGQLFAERKTVARFQVEKQLERQGEMAAEDRE